MFRETVIDGQVCFEADLNQFKMNDNWEHSLQSGFAFIVDTNREYDVKHLLRKKEVKQEEKNYIFNAVRPSENTFHITLKTISKLFSKILNTVTSLNSWSDPVPLSIVVGDEGNYYYALHYVLTDLKDVRVTEEFLGLGREITKCQNVEFRRDCLAREQVARMLSHCHCAPLHLRSHFPRQVRVLFHQKLKWKC